VHTIEAINQSTVLNPICTRECRSLSSFCREALKRRRGKRNPTFGIGIGVWWEVVVRIGKKIDVCLD
jgi:hypothetical protein